MKNLVEAVMYETDEGIGLDPLLRRFVYDKMLPPDEAKKRTNEITGFYQKVLKDSALNKRRFHIATDLTKKWILRTFR